MGREVRRVPKDWQHPKNSDGKYIALHEGGDIKADYLKWFDNWELWQQGQHPSQEKYPEERHTRFTDWDGGPPNPDDYLPSWPDEQRTHYQMYEDTSEGTPISPVFATPEELARWLVDNNATSFAQMTATYEQWLRVARGGFAPSLIIDARSMRSGVEGP